MAVVVDELKKMTKTIRDKKEITQVGTVSANNDSTIGEILSEAMDKVGKDGVITVEEAKSMETTLEIVEGMQFDRGYISPYFVTDAEKMEVTLEDPLILLHEKISSMKDMLPLWSRWPNKVVPCWLLQKTSRGGAGDSSSIRSAAP